MKTIKNIGTTLLLTIYAVTSFATTWAPIYPYIQKTENGKVKTHSVPFGVYDGPNGLGQTLVYSDGKLLYSIDKYFSNQLFTTNNGQFLIEINFVVNYSQPIGIIDDSGKITHEPVEYDGDAVNIYKDGKLIKTIDFFDLNIDTTKTIINEFGNWFSWNYNLNDKLINPLTKKMNQHPAFIENDKLFLITADNQLIGINIETGQITYRQKAYETLTQIYKWSPTTYKRKYIKVKYPDKFFLPKLQDGKTIEQGLAEFLNRDLIDGNSDSALIKIYFHTLLINKQGKCEVVYVSPTVWQDLKKDFTHYVYDPNLAVEITNWIKQQTFETKTFPRGFQKYKYRDFVYLK